MSAFWLPRLAVTYTTAWRSSLAASACAAFSAFHFGHSPIAKRPTRTAARPITRAVPEIRPRIERALLWRATSNRERVLIAFFLLRGQYLHASHDIANCNID